MFNFGKFLHPNITGRVADWTGVIMQIQLVFLRKNLNQIIGILLCSLAVQQSSLAALDQKRESTKDIVRQAESMIERRMFEDARAQLLKADQLSPDSTDVRKALQKLQKALNEAVNQDLTDASAAFNRKTPEGYEKAKGLLEDALNLGGSCDVLCFDLAQIYERLGELPKAIEYLARSLDVMPDGKGKEQVQEKLSELTVGQQPAPVTGAVNHLISGFNRLAAQPKPATMQAQRLRNKQICSIARQLSERLPENPTVVFNSAKCAELEVSAQDAMGLWKKYTVLAPNALDNEVVRKKLEVFSALDDAIPDKREEIKLHYLLAEEALDARRLDIALSEYRIAEQLDPTLPESKLKLGLLYDSCGNVDQASAILGELRELAKATPEQREIAEERLDTLVSRRAIYDGQVAQARAAVDDLLLHYNSYSLLGRRRELEQISVLLQPAWKIFPYGWEINELLAPVYEEMGNERLAMRSRDVMWLSGKPVSFYANVRIGAKSGKQAAKRQAPINGRIEIMPEYFQIIGGTEGPISSSMIHSIETTGAGALAVYLQDGRMILMDMKGMGLLSGPSNAISQSHWGSIIHWSQGFSHSNGDSAPLRRMQANKGVRMFQAYLGIEDAKLGAEKYTLMEKSAMFGWMVFNAASIYSSIYGPANAWTQVSAIYSDLGGIHNTIAAGIKFTRMVRYQSPVMESTQFRPIPTTSGEDIWKLNSN